MSNSNPFVSQNTDVLLVEPAFASIKRPSLALHLLQALGKRAGHQIQVLYANLWLAAQIGERSYQEICYTPTGSLIGERIFAHCAFGGPPRSFPPGGFANDGTLNKEKLQQYQLTADHWIDRIAQSVIEYGAAIVGCSTTFEQTTFSLALLSRVKQMDSSIVTILGGANCERPMGDGLYKLQAGVDFVFAGECDEKFVEFLDDVRDAKPLARGVLSGRPCADMNALPICDFSEYFEQLSELFPESEAGEDRDILLPVETSRGCWWGQKHHCTFCGLNGNGMAFRQKTPDRALAEVQTLASLYAIKRFFFVDNIMPYQYFSTFLPALEKANLGIEFFYEQKANLDLWRIAMLRRAGILDIQPGIESLSTSVLKKIKKGVSATQNIETLRLARSANIRVAWNILLGIPLENEKDYEHMSELMPLLVHLEPPGCVGRISIDRFSPYFNAPETYGITGIKPISAYSDIFPSDANIFDLAYHFVGDYASILTLNSDLAVAIESLLLQWQTRWQASSVPMLLICLLEEDCYLMIDTRELADTLPVQVIDEGRARAALLLSHHVDEDLEWAIEHRAATVVDNQVIPLATAPIELLTAFGERDSYSVSN